MTTKGAYGLMQHAKVYVYAQVQYKVAIPNTSEHCMHYDIAIDAFFDGVEIRHAKTIRKK